MMTKTKSFNDLMQEAYGDNYDQVFITKEKKANVISTGALSLDASIGIGGIPKGRFTTIYGPEGSGKSTIALSVAKEALKQGDRVLYIDVENQMYLEYIELLLGEKLQDLGSFTISKPKTSDDAFNIMESAINYGNFGLIILDSIAALSPPEESKKDFEGSTMGVIPRDLSKFFRRNAYLVREYDVAVLFINQVRDNIGSYVKSYTMPGGHALLHYSSLLIPISKAEEIKVEKDVIGIMTKFTIKKNKMSSPFRSYLIPIIFGKGVDTLRDTVSYAEFLGVIKRGGPFYKFNDKTLGRGMLETLEYLQADTETLDKIKEMCYNIVSQGATESEEMDEEVD